MDQFKHRPSPPESSYLLSPFFILTIFSKHFTECQNITQVNDPLPSPMVHFWSSVCTVVLRHHRERPVYQVVLPLHLCGYFISPISVNSVLLCVWNSKVDQQAGHLVNQANIVTAQAERPSMIWIRWTFMVFKQHEEIISKIQQIVTFLFWSLNLIILFIYTRYEGGWR